MKDWSLITDKGRHISCHQYITTTPGVHSTSSTNDLYKWPSTENKFCIRNNIICWWH